MNLEFLLITDENRIMHGDVLDKMHRLRHEVFVEQLKWPHLTSTDGREYDAYDVPEARYIVVLEEEEVVASVRMNRFDRPTLLADIFPHLVEFEAIPTDADAVDLSRFMVSPHVGDAGRMDRYGAEIITAILEYGVAEKLREFTAVISTHFLTTVLGWGLDVRAIGFPTGAHRDAYLAVRVPVSEAQISKMYLHLQTFEPRLFAPSFIKWHREVFGSLAQKALGRVNDTAE